MDEYIKSKVDDVRQRIMEIGDSYGCVENLSSELGHLNGMINDLMDEVQVSSDSCALLEKCVDEIEKLYGKETDLSKKVRSFLNNYNAAEKQEEIENLENNKNDKNSTYVPLPESQMDGLGYTSHSDYGYSGRSDSPSGWSGGGWDY